MFNIQPGMGLGFTASKEIAFGLGTVFALVTAIKTEVIWLTTYIKRTINLETPIR